VLPPAAIEAQREREGVGEVLGVAGVRRSGASDMARA
jgi:hypothetical protein